MDTKLDKTVDTIAARVARLDAMKDRELDLMLVNLIGWGPGFVRSVSMFRAQGAVAKIREMGDEAVSQFVDALVILIPDDGSGHEFAMRLVDASPRHRVIAALAAVGE